VPIDRDATLKKAEKLLRQGKLDAAIAEYVRLTADQPRDWTSVNALGDLYVRAGHPDMAVAQFARVADHLLRDGSLSKAAAVYKKILRIAPDDQHATKRLVEVEEKQAEQASPSTKRRRGKARTPADADDMVGEAREAHAAEDVARACALLVDAADIYEQHGRQIDLLATMAEASSLDPANAAFRLRMLRLLIAQGDIGPARRVARVASELLLVAEALEQRDRHADALQVLSDAHELEPDDEDLRGRLVRELVTDGALDRARTLAHSSRELLTVAEALSREERRSEALEVIGEAAQRDPQNAELHAQFFDACVFAGDLEHAQRMARSSRELLVVADAFRRQGQRSEALDAMRQALERDPENATLRSDFVQQSLLAGNLTQAKSAARTTQELLLVGDALERRGNASEALQARIEAAYGDVENAELRMRVARECALAGDVAQTIRVARTVHELLSLAELLDERGRSSEARDLLGEAARRDPENAQLRMRLAREHVLAGDLEQARRCARTATELALIAEILKGQDRPREALAFITEATQLDPQNADLRLRLVRECVLAGDLAAARRAAWTTLELLIVAEALTERGRKTEALDVVVDAAQRDPENVELRVRVLRECALADDIPQAIRLARTIPELLSIADLLEERGRASAALAVRSEAVRRDPENEDLRMRLAREHVLANDLERARSFLRTSPELLRIAELLNERGRRTDALDFMGEAVRRDPDNVELRRRVIREHVIDDDLEEARRCARTSAELVFVAEELAEQGRRAEALEFISEAAALDPHNTELRLRLVRECVVAGDLDRARRKAQIIPELLAAADELEQQGRSNEAREFRTEAALRDAAVAELRLSVAREWIIAGDTARARLLLRSSFELLQIADMLNEQGQSADALALMDEAVRVDPENDDLRMRLARKYVVANDLLQARALCRASGDFLEIADLLHEHGRRTESLEFMGEAARRDPDNAKLRMRLAREWLNENDLEQVRRYLHTSSELLQIAELLQLHERRTEALAFMEEAARLDPDNNHLRLRLAREWVAGGQLDRARTFVRTGSELLSLAELLEEQGKSKDALDLRAEAADRDPTALNLRARVARECVAAGDYDRARRFLTLKTAGDDPDLLLMLGRLELQAGRLTEGRHALNRVLVVSAGRRDELLSVAWTLIAERQVDAAYACVELVVDTALLEEKWTAAADALQQFVTRVPRQIHALMKLVEICVDGGLESTLHAVQGELADAYLAAGQGAEARVIAEDLVLREPWEPANVERFRRALTMLGVAEPDKVIAERLSGDSAFMGLDEPLEDEEGELIDLSDAVESAISDEEAGS
jgi:thioredoxin-like negative regulator of GroEL